MATLLVRSTLRADPEKWTYLFRSARRWLTGDIWSAAAAGDRDAVARLLLEKGR